MLKNYKQNIKIMNEINNQEGKYIIKMIYSKKSFEFFICERFFDKKNNEWEYKTIKNITNLKKEEILNKLKR